MRICLRLIALCCAAMLPLKAADSVVVFNEVQYHPAQNEASSEWVELHNQMAIDMDISAWALRGDIQFKFPEGTIIPPGGFLVIASDPAALYIETGATNLIGPFSGKLNNTGGTLRLVDRNDRLMDLMVYADGGKWPVAADGSGATLAKRNPDATSAEPENWTSSIIPGGTPGRANFPKSNGSQTRSLVALDGLWRYEASGTNLGTAWKEPGFNDSNWSGQNNATLLSYWPMDGTPDATRGTTGSFNGAPQPASDRNGAAGGALAFTGSSQQYMSVPGGGGLDGASSGTISLWVKWASVSQDADCCGTFGAVLGRQANGQFSDDILALNSSSVASARLVWRQSGGAAPALITGTTAVGTTWHHIAVTFSPGGSSLFMDGVLQGSAVGGSLSKNPATALAIGAWAPDGAGFATASIDDVAIWDQPLTAAQVGELAAQTKTPLDFALPQSGVYYSGDGKLAANDELRRTALPPGPITRYFRSAFNFADDPRMTELKLDLAVNDGAVFYLNGNEIYRQNMPLGAAAYSTLARSAVGPAPWIKGISIPGTNLVRGQNVLAVEVHEASQPDSGMVFGAALNATVQPAATEEERLLFSMVTPWKFYNSPADPGTAWKTPNYNDGAWSNGLALFYNGDAVIPPQRILGVTATASSEYAADGRLAMRAVDGSGLVGSAHVTTAAGAMWLNRGTLATPNDLSPQITFDLGAILPIRWMKVWNYNEFLPGRPELLNRGIATANILAGLTNRNYTTVITNQAFNKALGTETDFSQRIDLGGFTGRFVKLDQPVGFPGVDSRLVGLSEVQFFADADLKRTDVVSPRPATCFRKAFVFGGDPARARLILNALVDDGAVFYLNGAEVHRVNMPAGAISHETPALSSSSEAAAVGPLEISIQTLVRGTNILAVEVHQSAASSDTHMAFAASLTALITPSSVSDRVVPDLVFSEIGAGSTNDFKIELVNRSGAALNLAGWSLHRSGVSADADFVLPETTLDPSGFFVLDKSTPGFSALPGDKLFLFAAGKRAVADAVEVHSRSRARLDDSLEWLTPSSATLGSSNRFSLHDEIVINEIMYHAPPVYARAAETNIPYQPSTEQWVELYNRSTNAVSLAGWRLDESIDFRFSSNAVIGAGGYLVIANDPAALLAKFAGINVIGPFANSLPHRGGRIVLKDANDNPADVVSYFDDGRWPEAADAGGSSLELRDPHADNNAGESWAASDETSRSGWKTYTYRGIAAISAIGPDTQWREFVLGMLDAGELLLDDISVLETPSTTPVELLQNGTFETGLGHWRIIGNHHGEVIDDPDKPGNKVLHLKATGSTEHMSNHAETTLTGSKTIVNGREYQISFRAKWLSGSPQVNTRLYFNRLARTTIIDMPALHGTPGARNSRFVLNAGPTFNDLLHSPAVPAPLAPVTVSVRVNDPDGVKSVILWSMPEGGAWSSSEMSSTNGNLYTATLPGRAAGTIVQFYIEATDSLGASSTFPADGRASRALYKVDDGKAATNGLHNVRLVALTADANVLFQQINLMSNERIGCTMIYDENEIFYDVGLRLKGSEHSRTTPERLGFNVGFYSEHLFRGIHTTVAIDRSESTGFGQREMLIHQTLNHAGGVPTKYHDLINVIAPRTIYTGSAELQLARYSDVFLADQYENGASGNVYEYELIYQLNATDNGTAEGNKLPAPDSVMGTPIRNMGDDKEAYRWTFLTKNNEDRDDYSRIMSFAKAMQLTGAAFNARITNEVDIDQFLRGVAVNVLSGVGDSYGGDGSQHNVQFYVRPSDGKIIYFPHDMDAFFDATRPIVPNSDVTKMISVPALARLYYGHVQDIINTTYNANYLGRWAAQFGRLLPAQPFASHLAFITQCANLLSSQIRSAVPNVAFAITSGGDGALLTNGVVTVSGTAPLPVSFIEVNAVRYPITWTSRTAWTMQIPVHAGITALNIQGIDRYGLSVSNALQSVSVTNNGPGALFPVVINEWMADNAAPSGYPDPVDGLFQDWFELFNPNGVALNLEGYSLTDNKDEPTKFKIPTGISIAPHGFLLVWADNEPEQNSKSPAGELHVNFQLNNGGEMIGLFAPSGAREHLVEFGAQRQNISEGLFPDGNVTNIQAMPKFTPKTPNTLATSLQISSISFRASVVTLAWNAAIGRSYRVEYKDKIETAAWTPLGSNITPQTENATATLQVQPASRRFYRIVQVD